MGFVVDLFYGKWNFYRVSINTTVCRAHGFDAKSKLIVDKKSFNGGEMCNILYSSLDLDIFDSNCL